MADRRIDQPYNRRERCPYDVGKLAGLHLIIYTD